MKRYYFILILCWMGLNTFGQNLRIDTAAYGSWPRLIGEPLVSNDGNFVAYKYGSGANQDKISQTIQSIQSKRKIELPESTNWFGFSADSKYFIYRSKVNILNVLNLKSSKIQSVSNVIGFSLASKGSGQWLSYLIDDGKTTIVFWNLRTGRRMLFPETTGNWLNDDGSIAVVQRTLVKDNKENQRLEWINLTTGKIQTIWTGSIIESTVADFRNKQLAFKTNEGIMHYKMGDTQSTLIYPYLHNNLDSNLELGSLRKFSTTGDRLFISLIEANQITNSIPSNVPEVWSYRDTRLQSVQEKNIENQSSQYLAIITFPGHKLVRLQYHKDELFFNREYEDNIMGVYQTADGDYQESGWNVASQSRFEIINTKTGEIKLPNRANNSSTLSPNGKFIVSFDFDHKTYLSYEIENGETTDLTNNLRVSWENILGSDFKFIPRGIAGWLANDEAVLVYDSYDIWKFDLKGKKKPINLTNGYGLKNHIVFTIVLTNTHAGKENEISINDPLILNAFNTKNKQNGFFSIQGKANFDPVLLSMGSFLYGKPFKSRNGNVYLLKIESALEAPNYFSTRDFIKFKALTSFHPEKRYNWLTSELHDWESLDGRKLQGIMYKPGNFDPKKTYPIIFYCYERLSNKLNTYLEPEYSQGPLDIPTYVSNNYLVFCPDIYYQVGNPMKGALDAIVSAVSHVSTLPYVNSGKIGIQGHSFGAIQINYLITKTNLFTAACSASGKADWVSGYGSIVSNGASLQTMYETGQDRMGVYLWGNLEGYINNSPIFFTNYVTTPVLLAHGKKDGICPYNNAMEFFLALRRLGKKSWMLSYPNAYHTFEGQDSKDFSIRMMQFFDHYLKDRPAPLWMLNGVHAKDRAYESGVELDNSGQKPGPGLLTVEQQKNLDSISTRASRTITLK